MRDINVRWRFVELLGACQLATGERITQRDVSEATGISANAINQIANNRTARVDFTTLAKLLDYFSNKLGRPVDVSELLEYEPESADTQPVGLVRVAA